MDKCAAEWQLEFHPNKWKNTRIGARCPKHNQTMTAEDGTPIQLEETVMEKDLEVVVDNKVTFNQLINCIVGSAKQFSHPE